MKCQKEIILIFEKLKFLVNIDELVIKIQNPSIKSKKKLKKAFLTN